jgi:hypothetical protein
VPSIDSYNKRLEAMKSERSSFVPLWQELSDYHLSHRGRFLTSNRNKGHKRNTKQINNVSRLASRTLASGMMSGITSPARPWFRLGTGDEDLDQIQGVKQWLHDVQKVMYKVFSQSNLYNSLHQVYSELGTFGVASMGVYEDFDAVIWCDPYTVGSYFMALDGRGKVDTFYREYEITVAECIKQFGKENCSNKVVEQWNRGNTEAPVKVVHVVEPNDDRDMNSPLARDKKYRSVYYEEGTGKRSSVDKYLRESGFDDFPIVAPRWEAVMGDIYATDCPGMTALGDTKALQLAERRKYQAIDKVVNPPLQGHSSLRNKVNGNVVRPDEIVWHDQPTGGIRSIYENYRPDINAIKVEIEEVSSRISRAYYEDLFLMLAQSDRRQITAREVAEKHEEKLLMLGPVLERAGVLPVAPPELQNRELNVEYVSVLAQAQRLVSLGAVDRLLQFAGEAASMWPEVRHKVDASKAIDMYADSLGVDPSLVRSDDDAAELGQIEAQQQAQAQAMAQAQQMADVAKTASETDTGGDSALGAVMRQAGLA